MPNGVKKTGKSAHYNRYHQKETKVKVVETVVTNPVHEKIIRDLERHEQKHVRKIRELEETVASLYARDIQKDKQWDSHKREMDRIHKKCKKCVDDATNEITNNMLETLEDLWTLQETGQVNIIKKIDTPTHVKTFQQNISGVPESMKLKKRYDMLYEVKYGKLSDQIFKDAGQITAKSFDDDGPSRFDRVINSGIKDDKSQDVIFQSVYSKHPDFKEGDL
jgi:predicted RNase H-like nuclease (RuvC/YqgF family)|tara:strand:- start:711 stop:1373 length:663 start_codon:yes stop_codon:yes gene_type:complete